MTYKQQMIESLKHSIEQANATHEVLNAIFGRRS